MTYETGLDGVLLPAVCIQLYLKAEPIADSSVVGALHQTWDGLRRVAKAQHQADVERVKAMENTNFLSVYQIRAILKALGEKE